MNKDNKFPEIAEMLGVGFNEDFSLSYNGDNTDYHCRITEDGLVDSESGETLEVILTMLLSGKLTVKWCC